MAQSKDARPVRLDAVDQALLDAVSTNARASGAALARAAGVAESTVSQRLRRLRDRGVITGYCAQVDVAALGAPLQALISVRLAKHSRDQIDAFRRSAPNWRGVIALFHTAGADDYLLHVAARDADELREFVLSNLTGHPAVAHTQTSLIFEHVHAPGWRQLIQE